jgi:hypothetical protein
MLAIDHVLVAVSDLALAASEIEMRYGLASVEGGRHPAWGTANRIVPLGDTFLELVAGAQTATPAQTRFGGWVTAAVPGRLLGWAVRTDSIDEVANRLGLAIGPGSRTAPTGEVITWRSAGIDVATREPGLPFFIQWGTDVRFPGATPVRHPGGPTRLKRLSVGADPARLADWLGDHDLPLAVATGHSPVSAVVLTQGRRAFELKSLGGGSTPPPNEIGGH